MIFSAEDLRHWVVRDTLKSLDDHSLAAENLLLGTAAQESGLGVCLHQGKRRGLYHLTAATHRSVWDKYLINNPELASRVRGMAGQHSFLKDPHSELVTNLKYATAIAWMVYRRCDPPLPEANDIAGLANYWHRHFHPKPTASEQQFIQSYKELIAKPEAMAA